MDLEMFRQHAMNRRAFVKSTALTALGASALPLLAACGGDTASNPNGPFTITVTDKPGESDKPNLATFNEQVAAFQKKYPKYKIVGRSYFFDPSTYYARFAGGQSEDVVRVFLTEPQYMISKRFVADITDVIKKWEYFDSIAPSMLTALSNKNGRIFSVPTDGYKLALIYNRDLFKKAGLDPDKPPTTWEEFQGYAKQISGKGVKGFMEMTTDTVGGWHFTNWLYTAGGKAQDIVNGKWTGTFNSEEGVKTLQMYKDMRWKDKSLSEKVLVGGGDPWETLGKGTVGMIVGGSDDLAGLNNQYKTPLEQFGIGPMPTTGNGKGCLGGGNVWIFNPRASKEVIEGGLNWIVFRYLNLDNFEANLKADKASGKAIGFPDNAAFIGKYQQQRTDLYKKYATVPQDLYKTYFDAKQEIVAEPPYQAQAYYAKLSTVVQKILSDETADPKTELDKAVQEFQPTLDQATI